jgi:phospholipase/lecithinase/hemolysin
LEDRRVLSTFNVNSIADVLKPGPGVVTLRSAIQAANHTPGGNTINLTVPGTYKITLPGTPGETANAAGAFTILPGGGNLTIVNTSGGSVAVDGNHLNRVFDINPIQVPHVDHLYVFGDSFSDDGNFYHVTGQPASPPYAGGRFSNGPLWVEYLEHDLGLSSDQFTDLAYDGAASGLYNAYVSDPTSPLYRTGLLSQVNQFTAANPAADPNALYTVWVGINDYGRHPADPSQVVANIATAVNDLAAAGAKNILVVNLPDLGALPGTRTNAQTSAQLSALTATHNADLAAALGTLSRQRSGVNILPFDVNSLYNQMLANPGRYGFVDVTDSAIGNTGYPFLPPSSTTDIWKTNPSAVLFWDSIHPTTAGHQFIAEAARSALLDAAPKFTVALQGFTIQNGDAFDPANPDGPTSSGGGIRDQGNASLTLTNMVLSNNRASADGGGLAMENVVSTPWTLTVSNSVLSNNHAGDAGGGVETDGSGKVVVTGSTLNGNTSVNQGAAIWLDAIQVGAVQQGADLTMTGDLVTANAALNGPTGAIGNAGNGAVNITSSTVANNSSGTTGGGFGDENGQGTLTVVNSVFLNNAAVGKGGGIQEGGPMTISSTEIKGNATAASGGGVFANGTTLTILGSTISGNTAAVGGGGIELVTTGAGPHGSTIANSTFTSNGALNNVGANGGGIDAPAAFAGSLVLLNDTIDANFATNGGGVFWAGTGGSLIAVQNTIVARNIAATGPDANNPGGPFTDMGGNLIGVSGPGSGNTGFTAAATQTGTGAKPLDPLLGAVQPNGGPIVGAPGNTLALETQSLLPGSPAIDKGVNSGAPATDERGFSRVVNHAVDVGAYEFQPPATATVLTSSVGSMQVGQLVTFRATVTGDAPGSNTPIGTVTFFEGRRTLGTVPLNGGVATFTFGTLLPGSHRLTAVYNGATVGDFSFTPSTSTSLVEVVRGGLFAVAGAPGRVQVRRVSDGGLVLDFVPYAGYNGPISVALGDINGDGFPDLVTGAMEGNPDVRVFDGQALALGVVKLLVQFFPYGTGFNVGANVAVGDISGDGYADIVTGATMGNPDVRVYRGKDIATGTFDPNGNSLLAQFFPYALQFNVGANVAVGDVNDDGYADIVTGANIGNPDVRVYSGKDIVNHTFKPTAPSLLAQFFAYGTGFNVGAFVAVGDVNGDGYGDVIVGASAGNPQVKVYDGQSIAQGHFDPNTSLLDEFFAYNSVGANQGVSVAAADFEETGNFDILTGSTQGIPEYRVVKGNATGILPPAVNGIDAMATDLTGGLSVGA